MCDKGWTRYKLAKRTGYHWDHIDHICKCKGRASFEAAKIICEVLGVELENVFEAESNNS